MNDIYRGVIIEESLEDKSVLEEVKIVKTNVEETTKSHHTPWLTEWTLHTVAISPRDAEKVAEDLRQALERDHPWYADFKNKTTHYIVFRNKIFVIDRKNEKQYEAARAYGISLGIPAYQVDFSPEIE